jgi:hypothetical protein
VRGLVRDCAAAAVVGGILVGVLWWLLLPDDLVYVAANGEAVLPSNVRDQAFAVTARYAVLVAAAGAVSGGLLWWRHRARPDALIPALVVSGLAGAALGALVGGALGPSDLTERAAGAADGEELLTDLVVASPAVAVLWPMAALAVVAVAAGISALAGARATRDREGRGDSPLEPSPSQPRGQGPRPVGS